MHRTNLDSPRELPLFPSFLLKFATDFFNLLLARFHHGRDDCSEAFYPRMQQRDLGGS